MARSGFGGSAVSAALQRVWCRVSQIIRGVVEQRVQVRGWRYGEGSCRGCGNCRGSCAWRGLDRSEEQGRSEVKVEVVVGAWFFGSCEHVNFADCGTWSLAVFEVQVFQDL